LKVHLRFVGSLARKAGGSRAELELPESTTLAEALKRISKVYKLGVWISDAKEIGSGYVRIYVNGRVPRMDAVLRDGDEISLLPPTAGG